MKMATKLKKTDEAAITKIAKIMRERNLKCVFIDDQDQVMIVKDGNIIPVAK